MPRRPAGRSTRAISGSAIAWSNQWNAWAHVTTSVDPSGSGIASALPSSAPSPGSTASSSARISASGSTAVTRCPSATSPRVSLPVPAPRSTTSQGSSLVSQRTASCGYSGRARSYARATSANAVYGPRTFGSRLTITGRSRPRGRPAPRDAAPRRGRSRVHRRRCPPPAGVRSPAGCGRSSTRGRPPPPRSRS